MTPAPTSMAPVLCPCWGFRCRHLRLWCCDAGGMPPLARYDSTALMKGCPARNAHVPVTALPAIAVGRQWRARGAAPVLARLVRDVGAARG